MKNLLKREIQTVSTLVLAMRFNRLIHLGETKPANEIPAYCGKEFVWIEDELKKRLIRAVGHDFYPPDRIEKKLPSNYMKSLLKSRQNKPEEKVENKLTFKISIKSSIGSIVKEKNVHVDSRTEADLLANKMIRDLGLKKATYKIS